MGKRSAGKVEEVEIEGILAGEPGAFDRFYECYRGRVFAFILKRVACRAEAEDLTQETFIVAHHGLHGFERRSSVSSWLLGIANNLCRRLRRHSSRWMVGTVRARSLDDLPIAFDAQIERQVDARRILARFDRALSHSLNEPQQAIFSLRYRDNLSIDSIACELDKSRDAIKASLRRTRQALTREVPELERMLNEAA